MLRNRGSELKSALVERTTLRTILVAGCALVSGGILLFLYSDQSLWDKGSPWQVLVGNLGGLLIASVAIALIWELAGKRAFVDEVLAKVRLSHDVSSSGLTAVTHDFNRGIDWESLFASVEKLDIFVAYARTWRNTHHQDLAAAAKRQNVRIRIVLPNPDDELAVRDLARRFGYTREKLRDLILEAAEDFRKLRPPTGQRCTSISLWYLPASPQFTMYRFDRRLVLVFYNHTHELSSVPTLICEQGGTLYDFARQEFDAMIGQEKGLAKLVWEQNA